jgi:cytosine/uracil/thiamine/allantoin permease
MSEPRDTNPPPSSGQPRAHMGWTVVAVAAIVVIATVIWSTTDYSRTASKSEDQTTGQSTPAGQPWSGPPGPPSAPR